MEVAIYDTGMNVLLAKLRGGNPVDGLLLDKGAGDLWVDIENFEKPRIGSMHLGLIDTARVAAQGKYLGRVEDGKLVEYVDDEWFEGYANVQLA